jgi:hypothetical protein
MGQGAWDKVQPYRVKPHSDALWTMPSIPESHKRNIFEYRTGQIWKKNMAFEINSRGMRHTCLGNK